MMTILPRITGVILIGLAGSLIIKNWNARLPIVRTIIRNALVAISLMTGALLVLTANWGAVGIVMLIMSPVIVIASILEAISDPFTDAATRALENWVYAAREKGNNGLIVRICEQVVTGIHRGTVLRKLGIRKKPVENMQER